MPRFDGVGLSLIGGFFARALAWLVPMLFLWWLAREWLVVPVAALAGRAMELLFPWVGGIELDGMTATLITTIRTLHPSGGMVLVTPEVAVLKYCYGLPLLVAMLLATGRRRFAWWQPLLGALVILPFQAWGVCFEWLVAIAIHMREATAPVTHFTQAHATLIALGYQLGYLLLPTLVPLLLWGLMQRGFVATVIVEGSMAGRVDS